MQVKKRELKTVTLQLMKVLVTGGTGRVGTAVSKRLVKEGYDVQVIGIEDSSSLAGIRYAKCDIMDTADLAKYMEGCEAVIHLAALASPVTATGQVTFEVNVAGTFNVYEAAAKAGIKRLVQASSINALGCFWGNQEHEPQYLPIDEAHPLFTTDPYSFSKEMVEHIAAYYWRREGITSLSLRLPAVWTKEHAEGSHYKTYREKARATLDEFSKQDKSAQQARFLALKEMAATYRAQYMFEFPNFGKNKDKAFSQDPLWQVYLSDRMNYWAFITDEDAAQAFEKGLQANFEGSHPLFVNNHQNWLEYDSQTLIKLFFPAVTTFTKTLQAADTLVSIDKARALIGFEPSQFF